MEGPVGGPAPPSRRRRRALAAGLWLVATAGATGVSWAATSMVRASVTGDHPYLSPAAVASLAADPDDQPATTVPPTAAPAPTVPPTAPAAAVPPRPAPAAAPPVTAPHPAPARPAPPVAASHRATFSVEAGTVTVACAGDAASLVAASPADGYRVTVFASGPERVAVVFDGEHRRGVFVVCQDGTPVPLAHHPGDHDGSHDGPTDTTAATTSTTFGDGGYHPWPTYGTPTDGSR